MKATIIYNGEYASGIRYRTFEFDLDDMFEEVLIDKPGKRETLREMIKELSVLGNDVPDRILFSDECECGKVMGKEHQCFCTQPEEVETSIKSILGE